MRTTRIVTVDPQASSFWSYIIDIHSESKIVGFELAHWHRDGRNCRIYVVLKTWTATGMQDTESSTIRWLSLARHYCRLFWTRGRGLHERDILLSMSIKILIIREYLCKMVDHCHWQLDSRENLDSNEGIGATFRGIRVGHRSNCQKD